MMGAAATGKLTAQFPVLDLESYGICRNLPWQRNVLSFSFKM